MIFERSEYEAKNKQVSSTYETEGDTVKLVCRRYLLRSCRVSSNHLFKLILFAVTGYLAAGGCGVLNSFYDKDIDKLMPRTSKRAIPAGQVASNEALVLGAVMICGSFALSYFIFNSFDFLDDASERFFTWLSTLFG